MSSKETAVARTDQLARMGIDELKRQPSAALAQYAEQLRRTNVAALGDGSVFIRRDEKGLVRAVQASIKLDAKKGELDTIQGKTMISAKGYTALNQFAGISLITPPTLTLPDGRRVMNPYLVRERDERTGRTWNVGVWVKKVALGFSPIGNLVAIDSTLFFDLHIYFIQDALKKIQKHPEAGRLMMDYDVTEEDRKGHLVLPYQYGIVLVLKLNNSDVKTCLDTNIQRQKFAERSASTIAERNALKKHPAIAATQVPVGSQARVKVFGWLHDMDREALTKAASAINQDEDPGEDVTVKTYTATAGEDEADTIDAEAAVDEVKSESKPKDAPDETEETEKQPALFEFPDDANTPKQMRDVLVAMHGEQAVQDATEGVTAEEWKDLTTPEKREALPKIAEHLAALKREMDAAKDAKGDDK